VRKAVLTCALLLGLVGTAFCASTASAYRGSDVPPVADPDNKAWVKSVLANPDAATDLTFPEEWTDAKKASARKGLFRMQTVAKRMPGTGVLGSITAVGSAFLIGWQIGTPAGHSIYKAITGNAYGSGPAVGTTTWNSICSQTGCTTTSYSNAAIGGGATITGPMRYLHNTVAGDVWCYPYNVSGCFQNSTWTFFADQAASVGTPTLLSSSGQCTSPNSANCAVRFVTEGEFNANVVQSVEPITAGEYAAMSDKRNVGNWDSSTPSDGEYDDALDEVGANTPSTVGLDSDEDVIDWLNFNLDPTYETDEDTLPGDANFTPFVLPRPRTGETVQQYVERLRELGWHGTLEITDVDTSSYDTGSAGDLAAPGTVAAVRVGAGTVVQLYVPATGAKNPWPPNPPVVQRPSQTINVRQIPDPEDEGEDMTCDCPPVDVDPLLSTGTSDKFPFGVGSWFAEWIDDATAGDGTPMEFTVAQGDHEYTVEFPENPWRSYTDPLIKLFIVVGSMWFAWAYVTGWGKGDTD